MHANAAPRELALETERNPQLPEGVDERFVGYGVMAAPFESGDVLAMRRFSATSIGSGYTSVWHRDPEGRWSFWSDRKPLEACPRYFGHAIAHSKVAPIDLSWTGPMSFEMRIETAKLEWSVEMEATPATKFLNRLAEWMPDAWWRSVPVLTAMSKFAGVALHAGRMRLAGHVPNGQAFIANPMHVWVIKESSASLAGRDLGKLKPIAEQAHLGDFWIPQRPLFATGRAFFEPMDPARHSVVEEAPELAAGSSAS